MLSPGCGDTRYRTGKPRVGIVIRKVAHQPCESPSTGSPGCDTDVMGQGSLTAHQILPKKSSNWKTSVGFGPELLLADKTRVPLLAGDASTVIVFLWGPSDWCAFRCMPSLDHDYCIMCWLLRIWPKPQRALVIEKPRWLKILDKKNYANY